MGWTVSSKLETGLTLLTEISRIFSCAATLEWLLSGVGVSADSTVFTRSVTTAIIQVWICVGVRNR